MAEIGERSGAGLDVLVRGPWPLSWVSCQHITALAAYSIIAWL